MSLKIDIVVHGRFHAFALARALIDMGHDVVVLTNYPKLVAERFGVPRDNIKSFLRHGLLTRMASHVSGRWPVDAHERTLHVMFGKWGARRVRADADIVYGFSGVMEEYLRTPRRHPRQLRVLCRGSAHIRVQNQILLEEERRVGASVERPTDWMIEREEREYELADRVSVLSSFARDSFIACGHGPSACSIEALGVDVRRFQTTPQALEERKARLLRGDRLRILTVGTFSYRKGAHDLAAVANRLAKRMEFRFVGAELDEAAKVRNAAAESIEFVGRLPEEQLKLQYAWADIFLFPTIEDGFAAVLPQAAVAGLPIIATVNSAAPDIVRRGSTGWIVAIRDPDEICSRLDWCDHHRQDVTEMVTAAPQTVAARDWHQMGSELVALWHADSNSPIGELQP
ncbi:MAG: glycosyltransferase family 4 protein [Pseudomonadota bacterium]